MKWNSVAGQKQNLLEGLDSGKAELCLCAKVDVSQDPLASRSQASASAGGAASRGLRRWILAFVETSIQTSFPMTVKVDGVAQDGTTVFVHNKVHNRTRTLTCAEVSVCTSGPVHLAALLQSCSLG